MEGASMFGVPRLIGIGGFIGSGKTTLGKWLASEGALLLTFDAERKRLLGMRE